RRDLYERQRWIAASLYNAFVESKRRARSRMRYAGSLSAMLPWLIDDVEEIDDVFGGDAFPYGIEANRPTLQARVHGRTALHRPADPDRRSVRPALRHDWDVIIVFDRSSRHPEQKKGARRGAR